MAAERYQRGLDRMMELVSAGQSKTFDHVKLVDSYKSPAPDLADYIVSFAFGDIYSRTSLTQQEQTMVTISTLVALSTAIPTSSGGKIVNSHFAWRRADASTIALK